MASQRGSVGAGVRESLWQLFWLLFTTMFAVPFGLMAARLGRTVGALYRLLSRVRAVLHECVSKNLTRPENEPA